MNQIRLFNNSMCSGISVAGAVVSALTGCVPNPLDGDVAQVSRGMTHAEIERNSDCVASEPRLIGRWTKSDPEQTDIFSACEVIVTKSNGCSATFSYEVKGVILRNTLLSVSPARCGTVGTVSSHTYSITGNTLTIDATVFTKYHAD